MNENEITNHDEELFKNQFIEDEVIEESTEELTESILSEEEQLKLALLELEQQKEERKKRIRAEIWEWIKTIIFAILLYVVIDFFIARVVVDGNSMNPGIEHGNLMLVNKVTYQFSDIEYGDVVVFPYPNNPEKDYIKRVIAKEGDIVETIDGLIYVNGEKIDEFYLEPDITQVIPETLIPEDTIYVLGDNRNNSSDSRRWGTVDEDDLIGKAFFTYWPPRNIGIVK